MLSASKTAAPSGGYNLTNSLRIRSSANAFLNRTPGSAGSRTTWTWSGWVKRGLLSSVRMFFHAGNNGGTDTGFYFNSDNTIQFYNSASGTVNGYILTPAVFRDPSAWYHLVFVFDTTNATAANRMRIYVNGTLQTVTINTQIAQNTLGSINNTVINRIGATDIGDYFDGYLAEVNFIDGQALTPSSFGSTNATTGVWQPAKYTGTYGTNGFYLPFSDIATTSGSNAGLGKDFSGNANYWNTNNISVTAGTTYDAMSDVPTLTSATVANYAVLNPVIPVIAGVTLSNGNLNVAYSSGSGSVDVLGTIGISSGKWYWEYTFTAANPNFYLGWKTPDGVIYFGVGCSTGNVLTETSSGSFSGSTVTVTNGDVIGIAFDYAAGACYYYKNNTLFFTLTGFTTSSSTLFPIRSIWSSGGGASSGAVNFGQRPFAYTPPSGYLRLNTFNLPNSTIVKGNTVMDATLWTGTGGARTITNAALFQPDFVWVKRRSSVDDHYSYDSVRGANLNLIPNSTVAQANVTTYGSGGIGEATSTGFTIVAGTTNANNLNGSGITYVGWQWQAGQGSTSSNTSGSITSTVSVNATAGFSIATYSGATSGAKTVGHGLGVAPKMIIIKWRTGGTGQSWAVYHASLGNDKYLALNSTAAAATDTNLWQNTAPTSSVFSVGYDTWVNSNGFTYVAYCWAEIAGFSKFGSYTGNGSADGPFVYTGFRPKFVMLKSSSYAPSEWVILDTSRDTYNAEANMLFPNLSNAETNVGAILDGLSNGFKLKIAGGVSINNNGDTYIYMAFAENPFKNANAR